jgi:hypothetical protein
MKTIRRFVTLVVLAAIAYGALWLYESPFYALYEIKRGLDEKDVVTVERYVDLERMVTAGADVIGATAKEKIGIGSGSDDVASKILGALVGVVANKAGEAASLQGAMEMRRAIQEGRMRPAIGPFVVDDGVGAIGGYQRVGDVAMVDLEGHCGGSSGSAAKKAELRVMFEQRDSGPVLGYPKKSVLVGVDEASLPAVAKACR